MAKGVSSNKRPARLGRGLSALVGPGAAVAVETPAPSRTDQNTNKEAGPAAGGLAMITVSGISPNPHQPRRVFDDESLKALAESIRADGLLQPIVVRRIGKGFELVAGERRLRASKLAGITEIPAIVREVDDRTSAELALIENIQRSDLNPVDRALAYRALVERHGLTQAALAQRIGIDRTSVTNHLRLLEACDAVLEMVADGRLSFGHARALLGVSDPHAQTVLGERAASEGWSVRALERAVAEDTTEPDTTPTGQTQRSPTASPDNGEKTRARAVLDDMERRLSEHLGTRVKLKTDQSGQKGIVTIAFFSLDEFDGLLDRLGYPTNV